MGIKYYPKSQDEFEAHFQAEAACLEYFANCDGLTGVLFVWGAKSPPADDNDFDDHSEGDDHI